MNDTITIGLAGAPERFQINGIWLYPSNDIARWRAMLQEAQIKMGGVSTGLGFWGSPGWVVGGALVLGALETHLSNKQAKEGVEILQKAAKLLEDIRSAGQVFQVGKIQNGNLPLPELWQARAVGETRHDLRAMGFIERGKFIAQHKLTKQQLSTGVVAIQNTQIYSLLGEDFIGAVANDRPFSFRWSAVSYFSAA
jgi:hypothetical protein